MMALFTFNSIDNSSDNRGNNNSSNNSETGLTKEVRRLCDVKRYTLVNSQIFLAVGKN